MLLWDTLKMLTLFAAFVNPDGVYVATRQLQVVLRKLFDEVRTKNRSVVSLFPQLLLVIGRVIALLVLIVAKCMLGEPVGETDKTAKTTSVVIYQVQQVAQPLPNGTPNGVAESVTEMTDLPGEVSEAFTAHHDDGIIDTPPKAATEFVESGIDDTLETGSQCNGKTENDHDANAQIESALNGENGNSDESTTVVDTHDTKNPELTTITPPPMDAMNVVDLSLKMSENITEGQQDVPPQIDGRQQSNNQVKRQSLLLPELNPPKPTIEKPRRKFSIVQKTKENTDSKPKRLFSIFKKR
ncbi:hypothetical protein BGW37DRAFT_462558 [Umbelopsis sp. PMI_123]|nr:hypothetical protein BGW37DRAFT_462558 [Umbelopsis sp. PMI_123]